MRRRPPETAHWSRCTTPPSPRTAPPDPFWRAAATDFATGLSLIVPIGAVSTQHDGTARAAFGFGAIAASFSFFFPLGYGAQFLAPAMRRPRAWARLVILIALVMLAIAAELLDGLAA